MGNKRMYIGTAGIIAVALFIYLGFFAANPISEDVSGTINTVQKYQTDQISDTDVILEGEEQILDEMAELFDHATLEEKAELLGAATKEMTATFLGRCDKNFKAELWGRMDKAEQVAAFNAMNVEKQALLGRVEMTLGAFNRMDVQKQADLLLGANVIEKAAMFERAPQKAQLAALGRMDLRGRAFLMQGANVREKAMLMGKAPVPTRQAILNRMDMQGRMNLVRTASLQGRVHMYGLASESDKISMLQGATVVEKAELFGRLSIHQQIEAELGRMELKQDVGMLERASGPDREYIFATASPKMRRSFFGRLDVAKQEDMLGRMNLTLADFGRMDLKEQGNLLMGATTIEKQAMLGKANLEESFDLLGKMNIKFWRNHLGRMDIHQQADAFGRVDKKYQLTALGRTPGIQADMLERAPNITIENVLERAFLTSNTVQ